MAAECAHVDLNDQILAKLKDLLRLVIEEECRELVDIDSITSETQLTSLMLDSLATIELLYGIEQAFGIYLPDEDAFEFRTVGDVLRAIQARYGMQAPAL